MVVCLPSKLFSIYFGDISTKKINIFFTIKTSLHHDRKEDKEKPDYLKDQNGNAYPGRIEPRSRLQPWGRKLETD